MTTKKPTMMIVDGNSFVHRSFHALPAFTNKEGHPTSAISGTLNMISSVLKNFSPDKLVICFDAKGKTFRHDIFPDYKGTRPPSDPDLAVQFEPLKKIVSAWGLPLVCVDGVEADDSMGTLAVKGVDEGYDVIITTSDKDMRQLVTDNISILDTKDAESKKPYGVDGVIERMGVHPNRVRDLLALMGDKSDNVPGVNKVGQDTAAKWIAEYGSLASIIERANEFKGKRGEYLREALDLLPLSYELVTIKTDVVLPSISELKGIRDEKVLFELATKYELNQFRKDLNISNPDAQVFVQDIVLCETEASIGILANKLSKSNAQTLYIDSFSSLNDYLFIGINNTDKIYCAKINDVSESLRQRFVNRSFPQLIGNNIKEVVSKLIGHNVLPVYPNIHIQDTRLYYYAQFGGKSKLPSIYDLNNAYLQLTLNPLRSEFNLDEKTARWDKLTLQQVMIVKSEELLIASKIIHSFDADEKINFGNDLSLKEELDLLPILATMQVKGFLIDRSYLGDLSESLRVDISAIESEIAEITGNANINLQSPKQIAHLLFNVMNIPTNKPTTKESALVKLAVKYPVVASILKHRSLSKIRSTYVEGLISRMDDNDYIHPTFNQGLTITGRLSAENPSVQSIPIKSGDGQKVRRAFVSKRNFSVLALDYSQIELRIVAHMANDQAMIAAFNSGNDIHRHTASEVFGVPYHEVTEEQRRLAKAINFGLIYGMGVSRLAEETCVSKKVASQFFEAYFARYFRIKEYLDEQLLLAKANGYVLTDTGRKIMAPDVNASNPMIRVHAELSAKNCGIQGTAADIVRKAMVNMMRHEVLSEDVLLLMQVHDELVFMVNDDVMDEIKPKIQAIMEKSYPLSVPLLVNAKVADNWKDAH